MGPADRGALWCWVDIVSLGDPPDGGRANFVATADELAVDTAVSPRRVVSRHLDHQSTQLDGGGRPTGWASSRVLSSSAIAGVASRRPSTATWGRKTMILRSLEWPERRDQLLPWLCAQPVG